MNNISHKKKKSPLVRGFLALAAISFFFFIASLILVFLVDGEYPFTNASEKIAIVDISGIISSSEDIVKQLKKYRKDPTVKGIILRINSPGGAVAPSQEIYDEVLKIKKDKKKIITSMSTLAASGGYYIACPTDRIFANPGTITGSIGVIMTFSNVVELMTKVGLKTETIKSGKFKDTGSPNRQMSDEDKDLLQDIIYDVYDQFVEAVAKGRGMKTEDVKKLADGRIYSGRQAKEVGLVDELGSFEAAKDYLVKLTGIKGEPKIVKEEKEHGLLYKLLSTSLSNLRSDINNFNLQYLASY